MVQGEDVGPFGVIVRDRSGPGNDWDGQRFWGVLVERSAGSSAVSAAARLWSLSAAIVGKGTTLEPPPPPAPAGAPGGVLDDVRSETSIWPTAGSRSSLVLRRAFIFQSIPHLKGVGPHGYGSRHEAGSCVQESVSAPSPFRSPSPSRPYLAGRVS
jgi:hypothetical protein